MTKEHNQPLNRASQYYFEGVIAGTEHVVKYDGCPGRCNNITIYLDDDQLYYNASSHGTISLEMTIDGSDTYIVVSNTPSSARRV